MKQKFTLITSGILFVLFAVSEGFTQTERLEGERLKRAIGQLLMVGFTGTRSTSPGFRAVIDNLERGLIGGVLFLPQNIVSRGDLESMVRAIRQCSCEAVPLIAIDEEGGTVDRLGREFGFTAIPSAAEIGKASDEIARREYHIMAKKLADIGFNMNFAPVVDLNRNPRNPAIALQRRSYSADAAATEKYAKIFIAEHHALGILTTLKHFPGHGSSSADTHTAPADVRLTWSPEELVPFRHLIEAGAADAIMIGHLANPSQWGGVATQEGATAISKILRGDLNYDGVTVSDDLTMRAVVRGKSTLAQVVKSSIKGGVDLLLVGQPTDAAIDNPGAYLNSAIIEAVASGEIELSSVDQSWRRLTALKLKLVSMQPQQSLH
jgi:beta-N-acetylhexosaminidase